MAIRKKTGGRSKGTPNRTTAETKELLQKIVNKEIDGLSLLLEQLEPNERINAISKLLPYIVPKQSEVLTKDFTKIEPITFTIIGNKE
jgi:hypothetical protein